MKERGFEVVNVNHRVHKQTTPTITCDTKVKLNDGSFAYITEVKLPTRSDAESAGYDFYNPKDIKILPAQKTIIFTDVKAYMPSDWVLMLFIRSSLAIKSGLMLSNNVGIIDKSYYNNVGNDGNIGIPLVNTSGRTVEIKEGERIAQGIFLPFGVVDEEITMSKERKGGFGSSGK